MRPRKPSFERPLLTVDVVILGVAAERLDVLLLKRAEAPFRGRWALPGGFVDVAVDRDLESVAKRKLFDKTGVAAPYLEQFGTVGNAKRDPRGWSATTVYFALIDATTARLVSGGNAEEVAWHPVERLPRALAFDHAELCDGALTRFRSKVEYTSLPAHLLPDRFTLPDLQRTYEIVLGRPVDKASFRRRMLDAGFLGAVPGGTRQDAKKPAQLVRIKPGGRLAYFPRTFRSAEQYDRRL